MSENVERILLHFVKQYVNNKYRVKNIMYKNKGGYHEI